MSDKCKAPVEVYSRVCGFFRPVQQWNKGKKQEFADRTPYVIEQKKTAAPGEETAANRGNTSETLAG